MTSNDVTQIPPQARPNTLTALTTTTDSIHPPAPLYSRIRDDLRAQIVAGKYPAHARLPSESELISHYGVSRITVRHALAELENEGIVFKLAGKGVFVSKPKPYQSLARLQGFAEAMSHQGHEIFNEVIGASQHQASADIAQRLQVNEGDKVTEIRRVRYLNRAPVSLDITYVPETIGLRLLREDLVTRDIFLILENDFGIALGYAELAIDSILADDDTARLLQVNPGSPILRVERLTHSADGKPLDFEYLYCRSDNFQFRLRIER